MRANKKTFNDIILNTNITKQNDLIGFSCIPKIFTEIKTNIIKMNICMPALQNVRTFATCISFFLI